MLRTTVGRLLIDQALPEDFRGRNDVLDKKGTATLFDELARKHPEKYREVSKRLLDASRAIAFSTGGYSFGPHHLRKARVADQFHQSIRGEVDQILANPQLNDDAKDKAIVDTLNRHQKPLEDAVYNESFHAGNPFAYQVLSGSRGNRTQLKSLLGGDLLYADHKERGIPIPILSTYSQGLSPAEYFAGAFGARAGVVATKFATADSGYLAKQLNQATHRLVVTEDDDPDYDKASRRGLPVITDDPDNEGALLAHPAGTYGRNTVLTSKILADLKRQGHDEILVRSPMVGGPLSGGVYSKDVGVREKDGIAPRGDYVGIAASQSLSEKLTQGQLNAKHGGGVAGANKAVSGFQWIDSLVQVPKTFPGGATHSQVDGRVGSIVKAPQGGHFVHVSDTKHYVPAGTDISVAPGDQVEAGDMLSAGIPNPAEFVKHKGIGEGRRQFVKGFQAAYKAGGMSSYRRNVELLSRGLIDHVQVTDEIPGTEHIPDDIVPYQSLERVWKPREGAKHAAPESSIGKYLEQPVLHHTVGTVIRPSMLPTFKKFGINNVLVHHEPPPFKPIMMRGMANLQHDPDWMVRHLGSNLQKGTLEAVHRGRSSDTEGTSFVPAIADKPNFGRHGLTQGWKP